MATLSSANFIRVTCITAARPSSARSPASEKKQLKRHSNTPSKLLQFSEAEKTYFKSRLAALKADWDHHREDEIKALTLRENQLNDRLRRLTDAFLDGAIDRPLFEERKAALLMERRALEENLADLHQTGQSRLDRLAEFLELAGTAYFLYKMGLADEKRDLVKIVTSNRRVDGKKLTIPLSNPFQEVAKRSENTNGCPERDIPRTWDRLLNTLIRLNTLGQLPVLDGLSGLLAHNTHNEGEPKTGDGSA